MLESMFQTRLIKIIKERYGRNVWIYKAHDLVTVGIHDLILCFYGHFVSIELKKPPINKKEKPEICTYPFRKKNTVPKNNDDEEGTKLQKYNVMKITEAGGSSFVGRQYTEIIERLDKIKAIVDVTPHLQCKKQ